MKRTIVMTFAGLMLFACACNNTGSKKSKGKGNQSNVIGKKEMKSKLMGSWMNAAYLSEIKRSKSVVAGSKKVNDLLGFNIVEGENSPGGLILHGYTAHEGGMNVFLEWNDKENVFVENKNHSHAGTPRNLKIKYINVHTIELDYGNQKPNTKFRKAKNPEAVNKILFTGTFKHKGQKVKFKQDGNIVSQTGPYEFSSYEVVQDFFGCEVDRIKLTSEMGLSVFHYKIKGQTVELYHFEMVNPGNCQVKQLHSKMVRVK